jgi:Family of unknown function (DUF6283)
VTESRVVATRLADECNQVVTVQGGRWSFRPAPCVECPWRRSNDGSFPAEAFRLSASTSYDMAWSMFACHMFACHMAGAERPATCAGFLLSTGAEHNLALRLKLARSQFRPDQVSAADADLDPDYRAMAVANGVDPDDPAITP